MRAIILVCDSLHLGYLGCYGNEWIETPNLDRFAFDGFTFDQCYPDRPVSGGWLSAAFTGSTGFFPSTSPGKSPLASFLQQRGVRSAWIGAELLAPAPAAAEASNFDEVVTVAAVGADGDHEADALQRLFRLAAGWLKSHRDEPSLLWLAVPMDEANWRPSLEEISQYAEEDESLEGAVLDAGVVGEEIAEEALGNLRALYAGRMSYFDNALGDFLDELAESGLRDHCLTLITSDQGLPLGEHGIVGPARPWLNEERDHAPLLIQIPGGRTSARSPALVQSVDLYPTLCEHFGMEMVEEGSPGRSLLPHVRGDDVKPREYSCAGIDDREYAIRTYHWKLLLPMELGDTEPPRRRQLYAKPEDRWEVNDLVDQAADTADTLELQLRRYLDANRRGDLSLLQPLRDFAGR